MAMTETKRDEALEGFFVAARAAPPEPSAGLLARVAVDAAMVRRPVVRSEGLLTQILAAIGGWGGIGGMATATVAGIWIGFAGFADIDALAAGLTGNVEIELMPGSEDIALLYGWEN